LRTYRHVTVPYLYSADPNLPLEALHSLVVSVLVAQGVGLVELQFRRERPGWVLRVMIENPEGPEPGAGITLDRCAEVSRALSARLDEGDLIQPAYTLEVSSPGVERPLHDAGDYARFHGQRAKIVLTRPLEGGPLKGQAALVGALRGVDEEGRPQIEVALRGGAHQQAVAMGDIKLAHLVYDPSAQAPRGRGEGKGSKAPPPRQRPGHGKRSE
jgi:ribosome maturation factor RimP